MGWRAIKEFEKRGGTHIVLSNMPYHELGLMEVGDFEREFETTLSLARDVRENTGVVVFVSLGPYPVDLLRLAELVGREKAEEKMRWGMDLAAEYVRRGEAVAIGEVGRPHFPVDEWAWEASNRVLEYGMSLAAEVGCPVVVHCESATERTWAELAEMADRAGLPREKVVKHFSGPVVDPSKNMGLFPSVIASRESLKKIFRSGGEFRTRFLMETDYIDDPKRPGAVLSPATVPKRTMWLLESGIATESDMDVVHRKNPERLYGVEMGE